MRASHVARAGRPQAHRLDRSTRAMGAAAASAATSGSWTTEPKSTTRSVPPGRSTRTSSWTAAGTSGQWWAVRVATTTSTSAAASGRSVTSAAWTATRSASDSSCAACAAIRTIAGEPPLLRRLVHGVRERLAVLHAERVAQRLVDLQPHHDILDDRPVEVAEAHEVDVARDDPEVRGAGRRHLAVEHAPLRVPGATGRDRVETHPGLPRRLVVRHEVLVQTLLLDVDVRVHALVEVLRVRLQPLRVLVKPQLEARAHLVAQVARELAGDRELTELVEVRLDRVGTCRALERPVDGRLDEHHDASHSDL